MRNLEFGKEGERLAALYLESKNHEIIERNYSIKDGEIDLISIDGDFIVFTEVKSRRNLSMGRPVEAIDYKKIYKIKKVAKYYFYIKNNIEKQPRFDIVEVVLDNKRVKINHIKNAF